MTPYFSFVHWKTAFFLYLVCHWKTSTCHVRTSLPLPYVRSPPSYWPPPIFASPLSSPLDCSIPLCLKLACDSLVHLAISTWKWHRGGGGGAGKTFYFLRSKIQASQIYPQLTACGFYVRNGKISLQIQILKFSCNGLTKYLFFFPVWKAQLKQTPIPSGPFNVLADFVTVNFSITLILNCNSSFLLHRSKRNTINILLQYVYSTLIHEKLPRITW